MVFNFNPSATLLLTMDGFEHVGISQTAYFLRKNNVLDLLVIAFGYHFLALSDMTVYIFADHRMSCGAY